MKTTSRTRALVSQARRDLRLCASTPGFVRGRSKAVAPRFMQAYRAWGQAIGRPYSFVEFVRLLDPSVPTHKGQEREAQDGYLHNATYQAADYIRRQARRQ